MTSNTSLPNAAWQGDSSTEDENNNFEVPALERSLSEAIGKDERLTELAAPAVSPEIETGDDLEEEQRRVSECTRRESAALSEVAAPGLPDERRPSRGPAAPSRDRRSSHGEEKQTVVNSGAVSDSLRSREIATLSWLIFFSFLGTLARMGVEAIATYPYAVVSSPVLWANVGGSFFIGFLLEDQKLFRYSAEPRTLNDDRDHNRQRIDKSKKILPLYIGLATGFCGSFTSFSTFITDAFLALSNALPTPDPSSPYHTINPASIQSRNGGYSFMAVVAVLIAHPAISLGALKTGAHLAVGLEPITPSLPARFIRRVLDPLGIILALGCWVGAILLTIWPVAPDWRYRATMSLVFAPPGTLLRFYLARQLNARVPAFPLGTFAVNIIGTCVGGMCYDLQHTSRVIGHVSSGNANSCAILEGVVQGFCGCATTVSTWVVELNSLRRRHAWLYGFVSVAVALGFQVAIMGSVAWTSGFDQACGA